MKDCYMSETAVIRNGKPEDRQYRKDVVVNIPSVSNMITLILCYEVRHVSTLEIIRTVNRFHINSIQIFLWNCKRKYLNNSAVAACPDIR